MRKLLAILLIFTITCNKLPKLEKDADINAFKFLKDIHDNGIFLKTNAIYSQALCRKVFSSDKCKELIKQFQDSGN